MSSEQARQGRHRKLALDYASELTHYDVGVEYARQKHRVEQMKRARRQQKQARKSS